MGGLLARFMEWARQPEETSSEVAEYVLSRREPDPENRLQVYDEPVGPGDVAAEADLPPGVYLLQEIKPSGMAGDVVWEAALDETVSGE